MCLKKVLFLGPLNKIKAFNFRIEFVQVSIHANYFCANLDNLPLADNSLDLIVSNLAIDCLNINIDQWFCHHIMEC